jgi:LasA protease
VGKSKWGFVLIISLVLPVLVGGCARRQGTRPAIEATRPGETVQDAGEQDSLATRTDAGRAGVQSEIEATGLPNVGSLPEPSPPPQAYVVQAGDTLSSIAQRFGCSVQALVDANGLADPNALQVGQSLRIPTVEIATGPSLYLLPDSEFVYGPAYVDFDIAAFAARQGGYLDEYYERVDGELLSGAEIIGLIAHHYSVGPRLLLAILELRGSWVTNPSPADEALSYPMGYRGSGWELLSQQLAWAADELNKGYYDWRGRGVTPISWGDGTAVRYASGLNAATAGLQYFLSLHTERSEWLELVGEGPGSFLATYRELFGDPAQYAIEPLIPADVVQPTLALPWSGGELWYYTGGPHGGWNDGSAWAALDFVPDEGFLGCAVASSWATAAAPGLVVYSQDGEVTVDLDGDGHEQTGWVLFYLHVASVGRVPVGSWVEQGDPIGHPSCEGGFSEASHLHLARKYNGEWIAADGPLPLILSGWTFLSGGTPYEGTAVRGDEERTACECRRPEFNGLVADR